MLALITSGPYQGRLFLSGCGRPLGVARIWDFPDFFKPFERLVVVDMFRSLPPGVPLLPFGVEPPRAGLG